MVRIMTAQNPLQAFRKDEKLTLNELARLFNVNRTTVFRWERGVVKVPPSRLADIERLTGIPRAKLRPDIFKGAA